MMAALPAGRFVLTNDRCATRMFVVTSFSAS